MDKLLRSADRSAGAHGVSRRRALGKIGKGGLAASALLGVAAAGVRAQSGTETAMTEATARQAINAINDALGGGDGATLTRVFSPDYVNHTPHRPVPGGETYPPTFAGLASAVGDLRAAAPNATLIVEEIVATGDTAAVRLTFRATVKAVSADSGETVAYPVTVGGIAIVRVRDRQIVESWDYNDFAELYGDAFTVPPAPSQEQPAAEARGERREIANVTAVTVEGIGLLQLTQAETESLSIEAEPKVLRRIATEVRDGRLFIRPDRSLRTREPIVYHLSVVNIDAIELSGAVEAETSQIETDALQLSLSGSSAMTIGQLAASDLAVVASGNGSVAIGGELVSQTVELSGSVRYSAAELRSKQATLSVSGAGQAEVRVSDRLDVTISGAGSVAYYGNPEITQSISGAGSLRQAG